MDNYSCLWCLLLCSLLGELWPHPSSFRAQMLSFRLTQLCYFLSNVTTHKFQCCPASSSWHFTSSSSALSAWPSGNGFPKHPAVPLASTLLILSSDHILTLQSPQVLRDFDSKVRSRLQAGNTEVLLTLLPPPPSTSSDQPWTLASKTRKLPASTLPPK